MQTTPHFTVYSPGLSAATLTANGIPPEPTSGEPVVSGLPSAPITSSLANTFSMGASNLIVTSEGGAESRWPADGVSCSGNECAEATGTPITIPADNAAAPNINSANV